MAMTSINIRVDEQDKRMFDRFCSTVGMNMSTAVNVFIKATLRENRIPFELRMEQEPLEPGDMPPD